MTPATVLFEARDNTGILRLNRPHRMNAVIERMYEELGAILDSLPSDPAVRALILTGAPPLPDNTTSAGQPVKEAFCAGADLKHHADGGRTPTEKKAYIELAHATCLKLRTLPLPVIAAVNGPARGAGTELALNCDFVLMADTATLAFPETGLGTMVGGGVTRHLERTVGLARARELIYTGRVLNGPEAVQTGLALASVPADHLLSEAMALAARMTDKAPLSMALAKSLMERAPSLTLEESYAEETKAIVACMESRDWQEGIDAFKEKRRPIFKGV
ncbi:enoyl-CoA hydratase/isomerase family protein [Desulfoluna spongiiphila]|uniref:Enoyl-CoA hydratase n=1 Tax=Desulfoluna spongiiphila TaxID=419481 RepID=A0A1G5IET8_9BACT|nr:enoyl-CoA hydratase/isomerase family protein [Desulfoluna spongiiphila]SCY74606.1 enoyl-CoA hydratase [Desulfoluna spongiiphila]